MPQNKRIVFSEELQKQARFAQAMCHPARIKIMNLLNDYEFLICTNLVDFLPYSQPGVSYHLDIMLEAGLIKRVSKFGSVGYQISREGCEIAKVSFQHIASIF